MTSFSKLHYQNPLRSRFSDEFFKELPENSGVYFFLDENHKPIYIGKADCLKKRIMSYRTVKPGSAPEHILEMIEHARNILWESHPSGKHALIRESELIKTVRPPFNIAGVDFLDDLMIGIRFSAKNRVDFRLSHREIDPEFTVFGCFKHRSRIKFGYAALLRLLYASTVEGERFHFPAKLCQAAPPYVYSSRIPPEWRKPLRQFLAGESRALLEKVTFRLLENENIHPFMYAAFQKDLETVATFFRVGPQATREVARSLKLKGHFVPQEKLNDALAEKIFYGPTTQATGS